MAISDPILPGDSPGPAPRAPREDPGGPSRRGRAARRGAGGAEPGTGAAGPGAGARAAGGPRTPLAARIGGVAKAARLAALPVLRWFSPRRLRATAAFLGEIARQVRRRRAEPRLTVGVDVDALYETLTGVGWYLYQILDHLAQRDDLRLRLYGFGLAPPGPLATAPRSPLPAPAALLRTVPADEAAAGAWLQPIPPGSPSPPVPGPPPAPAPGSSTSPTSRSQVTQPFLPAPPPPRSPLAPVPPRPAGPAIEQVTYAAPDGLVVPPWRADRWLRRAAPLLLAADGNRVLFGPNFMLPRLFRFARGARVVAVHDLAFRRLPWVVRPDTARALADGLDRTLLEADLLLADSQAVAGELAAAGVAPARVRSIHLGPGHLPPPSVVAAASPPPGTPARYGLFVGTLEPRKNVATLLAAWRELRRDGGAPPLLLCGPRGWRAQALRRELADAESEGWLRYLGYVSPVELAALYRGAAVVALPSLYEGFGMPAVEALAAGAPLVLSDLPVFREVAGDAALYAPARRPDLWRERLRQVLDDDGLRLALSRRARERGACFDWRRAAAATADAWREAAGTAPE